MSRITGRVSEVLDAAELKKVPADLPDEIEASDVREPLAALSDKREHAGQLRREQIRTLITPGAGFTILSRLPINYGHAAVRQFESR